MFYTEQVRPRFPLRMIVPLQAVRAGSHKQRLCGVYASSQSVRAIVLMIVFDVMYCRLRRSFVLKSGHQRQGLFINFSHRSPVTTCVHDLVALQIGPRAKRTYSLSISQSPRHVFPLPSHPRAILRPCKDVPERDRDEIADDIGRVYRDGQYAISRKPARRQHWQDDGDEPDGLIAQLQKENG